MIGPPGLPQAATAQRRDLGHDITPLPARQPVLSYMLEAYGYLFTATMPLLLQLPNEVASLIACELDLRSLLDFRLASRYLNAIALPAILKRRFETRHVMLQQHSLENLIDISRHPVYGPALKTLSICIDHVTEFPEYSRTLPRYGDLLRRYHEGTLIPGDYDPSDGEDGEEVVVNRPIYDYLLEDQKHMMESGLSTTYLAQAMAAFPNLETVVVDDAFKPWGATVQERLIGARLVNSIEGLCSIEFVTQTLRAIILAIAASNVSLDEFCIAVGHLDGGISPDMLVFPRPVLRYIQSHPLNLTSLSLSVSHHNTTHPQDQLVGDLLGFIALFPRLQRLSLGFNIRHRHEHFSTISQTLRLPGLRFLGISTINCNEGELETLLIGHKDSLEEVQFSAINILPGGGTWQALLGTVRDKLSIRVLGMDKCLLAEEEVHCRSEENEVVTWLDRFEISGTRQDWTDAIDDIVIGRTGDLHIRA